MQKAGGPAEEEAEGEGMGEGGAAGAQGQEQTMSAAAFVEGGVQDAPEDSCSICLESFDDDEPATVTTCRHEYHLQCILEWAQRSKECPMCWQPLCLKDPDSQAILAAAEQERVQRSTAMAFHHPHSHHHHHHRPPASALDDSLFHRFAAAYENSEDFEDRIINHLAAAAMGRAHQFHRMGEAMRFRPPGAGSARGGSGGGSLGRSVGSESPERGSSGHRSAESSSQHSPRQSPSERAEESPPQQGSGTTSSSSSPQAELSFPDTLKSRLVTASSRYRETLTKTTRGLRDRFRARGGALAELAGNRAREAKGGSEGSGCTQDRGGQQPQQQSSSVAPLAV